MKNPRYLIPILVFTLAVASKAELLIPAYTAYLEPDAEGDAFVDGLLVPRGDLDHARSGVQSPVVVDDQLQAVAVRMVVRRTAGEGGEQDEHAEPQDRVSATALGWPMVRRLTSEGGGHGVGLVGRVGASNTRIGGLLLPGGRRGARSAPAQPA